MGRRSETNSVAASFAFSLLLLSEWMGGFTEACVVGWVSQTNQVKPSVLAPLDMSGNECKLEHSGLEMGDELPISTNRGPFKV